MSIRSLLEINHDYAVRHSPDLLEVLESYLNSANNETAEALERFGIRVISQRHHSTNFVVTGEPDGFPVKHVKPRPA